MIQISSLYSLENIADYYYITSNLDVINIVTNVRKRPTVGKRGYPYVTLQCKDHSAMKIPMYKIVALGFINNDPYTLIEHLDDDKLNYQVNNLKFSNKSANGKRAFVNGLRIKGGKVYEFESSSGQWYMTTLSEISVLTGIPKGTLYDRAIGRTPNGPDRKYGIVKLQELPQFNKNRSID